MVLQDGTACCCVESLVQDCITCITGQHHGARCAPGCTPGGGPPVHHAPLNPCNPENLPISLMHGTLSDDGCVCQPAYSGKLCEIFDPCFGGDCHAHGACTEVQRQSTGSDAPAACACDPEYSGSGCEIFDKPPPKPPATTKPPAKKPPTKPPQAGGVAAACSDYPTFVTYSQLVRKPHNQGHPYRTNDRLASTFHATASRSTQPSRVRLATCTPATTAPGRGGMLQHRQRLPEGGVPGGLRRGLRGSAPPDAGGVRRLSGDHRNVGRCGRPGSGVGYISRGFTDPPWAY
jgi:hypothetical protein